MVYTIGHSSQSSGELLASLRLHDVTHLCDVRTVPRSSYAPQFNREALSEACHAVGIAYEWHGRALGGRFVEGGVEGRLASDEGRSALATLAARAASNDGA